MLTSSTGFGSNTSYGGSITSSIQRSNKYGSSNQNFDEKSLDDQLKELDSQLLSKVFVFALTFFDSVRFDGLKLFLKGASFEEISCLSPEFVDLSLEFYCI